MLSGLLATVLANLVFLGSAVVGIMGVLFHLQRAGLPAGPIGERFATRLLVWGPPFLGPMMFVLIALWGISAAWVEEPPNSGRLRLLRGVHLDLPLGKTSVYLILVGLASLTATISAVLDHARTGWVNPYLWIPTVAGLFAAVVAIAIAGLHRPTRSDALVFFTAMMLLVLTGLLGLVLHVDDNLTSRGIVVAERFIRGAPFLAPLLFTNVGIFGILAMLDPRSERPSPVDELALNRTA